jgi:hypothetical protein
MMRVNRKFRLDIQTTSTPIFDLAAFNQHLQTCVCEPLSVTLISFFWFSIFLQWKILPPATAAP